MEEKLLNRNLAAEREHELPKHACGCVKSVNVELCHICSMSDIGCFIKSECTCPPLLTRSVLQTGMWFVEAHRLFQRFITEHKEVVTPYWSLCRCVSR